MQNGQHIQKEKTSKISLIQSFQPICNLIAKQGESKKSAIDN